VKRIIITESQFKRLLNEESNFGRIPKKINSFVTNAFKYVKTNNLNDHDAMMFFMKDLHLTEHEANILYHNYKNIDEEFMVLDSESLLGRPMEWIGKYKYKTEVPATIYGRAYVPATVDILATSKEDAKEKIKNSVDTSDFVEDDDYEPCDGWTDFDSPEIVYDMVDDMLYDLDIDDINDNDIDLMV
jgi:hypothetical protein